MFAEYSLDHAQEFVCPKCAAVLRLEKPALENWAQPKLKELSSSESVAAGTSHLTADETKLLKRVSQSIIARCSEDPRPKNQAASARLFGRLRARRVTFTSQGESALVVQGFGACMCGAVGNCPFWLIAGQTQPELLLSAVGIQTFAFRESASDHFDLILGSHDSAMVTDLQRFRYAGTRYRRIGCARVEWDDESGNELHPPRITAERCW